MKKILIIGFGYWGSRIFKTISKIYSQKYKIIVFDSLPSNKNQYYNKNVDYVNNYQDLNFSVIDYFVISTSISSHLFFIKKLAKYKKPIFVEKTLTNSYKNFLEVEKLKKKYSILIFTGYVYLYNKNIKSIKTNINKIKNKDFLQIRFERFNLGPIRKDTSVLNDLLSHDVAILFYFFPNLKLNFNFKCMKFTMNKNIDSVRVDFNFKNINFTLSASWLYPRKERKISIIHKKGLIFFSENEQILHINKFNKKFDYNKMLYNVDNFKKTEKNQFIKSNSLEDELKIFLKQNKKDFEENFKVSKKVEKILDRINNFKII